MTIANAVGNGVADDKLVYTYVPELIRYYLGEEPVLPNVETHRLEDDGVLRVGARPPRPAGAQAGRRRRRQGHRHRAAGRRADAGRAARDGAADPRGWIAQRPIALSTAPTLVGDRIAPRHVDLRPFAVNDGNEVWVLPGGLTRVALPEGALVVNSSQGGGSKDTWVLAAEQAPLPPGGLVEEIAVAPVVGDLGVAPVVAPRASEPQLSGPLPRDLGPGAEPTGQQ